MIGLNIVGRCKLLDIALRTKIYNWYSNRAESICLAGIRAVLRGPSSTSMSSGAKLRLEPKLSDEAPPTSEGGPGFPVALVGISGRGGGNGSTMKASVRWSPSRGVPSAAVVKTKYSHVARRRAARVLSVFSLSGPWPPRLWWRHP